MPVGSCKELLLSVFQTFWCVFSGFFCSWSSYSHLQPLLEQSKTMSQSEFHVCIRKGFQSGFNAKMHSVPELASGCTCFAATALLPGLGLWTETRIKLGTRCWWHVAFFVSCSLKKRFFPFQPDGSDCQQVLHSLSEGRLWSPGSTGMSASADALSAAPVLEAWAGQGFISGRCLFYLRACINHLISPANRTDSAPFLSSHSEDQHYPLLANTEFYNSLNLQGLP